ncbi:tail fiber protein [Phaeobacter sp. J2-8]|uniref:phage tail protein n=1 Tax=Phaeobacter sp. J2-8 TaxID=2931394 RepID=UPI001FD01453|nr:tail fiber protein [Phaeobacter sp. J2-8]MCJ7874802.1 tail fiber protein [Phaeobacter sp. J2-8]
MTKFSKHLVMAASALGLGAVLAGMPDQAAAQDRYIGEIMYNGYTFCPRNTLRAEGQLLPISQHTALFSLYGTTYGGDGRSTFGLPDLSGRVPIGQGTGPGLSPIRLGEKVGTEDITLNETHLANHKHAVNATNSDGNKPGPGGKLLAAAPPNGTGSETIYSDRAATTQMNPEMIAETGGNLPVQVMDPYLVINYCVVLTGIYPSRP